MIVLAVVIVVVLAPLLTFYNAYWITKVWALLVVPTMGLEPLPLLGVVGIGLVLALFRPQTPDDKETADLEEALKAVSKQVFQALVRGPLAFVVAWIVMRVFG